MIKYYNKLYIVFLTSILVVLSVYNIITLVLYLNYISLIPLIFQLPMLYFIYRKQKELKIFIKIWSIILLIGGIAGWVSIIANLSLKVLNSEYDENALGFINLMIQSIRVMVPIYFLMFLNESIVETKYEDDLDLVKENDNELSV